MSTQPPYHWIRAHGNRMDSALRSFLFGKAHWLRYIPCTLHHKAFKTMQSFSHVPVLVQFDSTQAATWHQMSQAPAFKGLNVRPNKMFSSIQTCAMKCSLSQLEELVKQPGVRKVYLDRKVHTMLNTATPTSRSPKVWSQGYRGKGVTIAIIDTGIALHPDLVDEGRLIAFKDFVNNKKEAYDDNGHGTHCAGIAAGNGGKSDGKYRGAAPAANIIGVKVLDRMGSGSLSDVIAGIEWCMNNKEKYKIKVISLSLGSRATQTHREDPVCQISKKAVQSGLTVVVAAGNEGPEERTISSPGIEPSVITVGASNDKGTVTREDDSIASFSSRGPTIDRLQKPDVVAPGTNITSLRSAGSYIDKISADQRVGQYYTTMSGTSMATPLVAGIAALLYDKHPDWTPAQVKKALASTATDMKQSPQDQGSGQVQADAASQMR
ncbi:S8 family peptidase [Mechercharimyces sp. CAU 1602]|uniref:S8 family peptidase n=1 Tax=Mechercharimyces sp. CAU 1602 TaxID=2973933 RepID=UPI00216361DE|nr:S8 family peptidase [Mechercharimyces sp. CAU 1602]MCS1350198.1 S8 family peptidase [Mechercharimyces sp. CAU 1602]